MVEIETPMAKMKAPKIAGKKLVFAPILRAGLALVEGMLDLVPAARVAHIGLYREPRDLQARSNIIFKTPGRSRRAPGDRGLARWSRPPTPRSPRSTGSRSAARPTSASSACSRRPRASSGCAASIRTCQMWTAAIDEHLDDDAFIIPGLGDAGDRAYGTK